MNYLDYVDEPLLKKFEHFLQKTNQRTEVQYGLRDVYDDEGDAALGADVEYFHHCITADDRMRYIMENIVTLPDSVLSQENKIGNTIISHFYGARGIHTLLTGETDPKKAHVDFVRIGTGDVQYTENVRQWVVKNQAAKQKFYGTTELHTSLQTAARNYCRVKYNDPVRKASATDIAEWIGSWAADGSLTHIATNVKSLGDMFKYLKTKAGVGEYYGYHCSTSNSVNPHLPFDHDERFCSPGPGARESIDALFAPLKTKIKRLPHDQLVILLREKQNEIFDPKKIAVHPFFHNLSGSDGNLVFQSPQNELKTYGTEVACCQFGVYRWLTANPRLINKRKVARVDLEQPKVLDTSFAVANFLEF